MNGLHGWTRNESNRFIRVNPECEHRVESVYEFLWPVVVRNISETRLEQAIDYYSYNPYNAILSEMDAVFREAFGILKVEGKFAAGEVEKYLSDLDATAGMAARYIDLYGVYVLLQVVPMTQSQLDKILHDQLFSQNGKATYVSLMGYSYNIGLSTFGLRHALFIAPVVELFGPDQRKHMEHVLELVENVEIQISSLDLDDYGPEVLTHPLPTHIFPMNIATLIDEFEKPEEKRYLTSLMRSYFKTAVSLGPREYNLDLVIVNRLEVAGQDNILRAIEYFGSESDEVLRMGTATHLIRQMAG